MIHYLEPEVIFENQMRGVFSSGIYPLPSNLQIQIETPCNSWQPAILHQMAWLQSQSYHILHNFNPTLTVISGIAYIYIYIYLYIYIIYTTTSHLLSQVESSCTSKGCNSRNLFWTHTAKHSSQT